MTHANAWMFEPLKEWKLDLDGHVVICGGFRAPHMFETEAAAHEARTRLAEARAIWHDAMRMSHDRITSLLDEHARLVERGDVASAGAARRTIEDLCGHWRDGRYIGLDAILEASALCRAYADVRPFTL